MNEYEFNRSLFVRNSDEIFKIAVMITKYNLVGKDVQEFLFFANKSIVVNGINFLTFTEIFNELNEYTKKWISDLSNVTDEFDWSFHRSKLLTRLGVSQTINQETYEKVCKKLEEDHPSEARTLRNMSIIWNNSTYLAFNAKYFEEKNKKVWELWSVLKKYSQGNCDDIFADEDIGSQLSRVIKYRNENDFYKKYAIQLSNNNELFNEVQQIEKNLSIILFKQKLSAEIPILGKLKKVFKL